MGRPKEHDEATRATLLEAAEGLLAEGGPDVLSVRRVSDAAGTSTRAVYSLFGSKDGLLRALYQSMFRDLRRRVLAVPETRDPVADLVGVGVEAFRAQALAHPHLFRLAFEWPKRRTTTTDEDRQEAWAAFEALLTRVKRVGPPRGLGDEEARRLAVGFHALCQGLASGELGGFFANDRDPLGVWRGALATYVKGLRVRQKR
ncbi:MAG: TetR/AcrR family transcriptional regulator [Reyranella sp.]